MLREEKEKCSADFENHSCEIISSFRANVRKARTNSFLGQSDATFNFDLAAEAVVAVFAGESGADTKPGIAELHAWAENATDCRGSAGFLLGEFAGEFIFEC